MANSSARFSVILVASWMSYDFTSSPIGAGLVAFLGFAPPLLLGPFIGSIADRFERSRLIVTSSVLGCSMSVFAIAAGFLGRLNLFVSLFLALCTGLAFTLEQPSRTALVPSLVGPNSKLMNSFSVMRLSSQGAEFIGPAITTTALALAGSEPALAVCAAFYGIGAVFASRIHLHPMASSGPLNRDGSQSAVERRSPAWSGVREGLSYIKKESVISALILFVGFHCTLTMAFTGLLPSISVSPLGGGSETYGLIMTCIGAGSIAGSLLTAFFPDVASGRSVLLLSAILSGATLSFLGVETSVLGAYVVSFAIGASQSTFMVLIQAHTQSLTKETFRGRVAGLSFFFTAGVMGISSLVQGYAATLFTTPDTIILVTGVIFVLVTFVMIGIFPNLRSKQLGTYASTGDTIKI